MSEMEKSLADIEKWSNDISQLIEQIENRLKENIDKIKSNLESIRCNYLDDYIEDNIDEYMDEDEFIDYLRENDDEYSDVDEIDVFDVVDDKKIEWLKDEKIDEIIDGAAKEAIKEYIEHLKNICDNGLPPDEYVFAQKHKRLAHNFKLNTQEEVKKSYQLFASEEHADGAQGKYGLKVERHEDINSTFDELKALRNYTKTGDNEALKNCIDTMCIEFHCNWHMSLLSICFMRKYHLIKELNESPYQIDGELFDKHGFSLVDIQGVLAQVAIIAESQEYTTGLHEHYMELIKHIHLTHLKNHTKEAIKKYSNDSSRNKGKKRWNAERAQKKAELCEELTSILKKNAFKISLPSAIKIYQENLPNDHEDKHKNPKTIKSHYYQHGKKEEEKVMSFHGIS